MGDFYVLAVLYAKEGQESRLRAELTELVEPSRRDEGNLQYDLFVDRGDARRFVFVEHWADPMSQERHHTGSTHISHFHAHGISAVESDTVYQLDRIA